MSAAVTRTKWKWFWAWDAPKEEQWLEQMAGEGWRLVKAPIAYKFVKAEPEAWRYRLDYRTEPGPELREYIGLCKDAGWEHVCRFSGWHYFRTSDPKAPELHSDPSSLADRYKRLLVLLAVLLVVNIPFFTTPRGNHAQNWGTAMSVINAIRVGAVLLLGYGVVRIGLYIRQLKAKSRSHIL